MEEEMMNVEEQRDDTRLNELMAERMRLAAIMHKHADKVIECAILGKTFAEEYPAEYAEYLEAYNAARGVEAEMDADPEMHKPWEEFENFVAGDRCTYGGNLYRVVIDHQRQADWTPDVAVALFVKVGGGEEWPQWVQPQGAHDAYNTGDKVTFNGKHYVSIIDANVYAPNVYGWEMAE